jgi:hypothetical protein
MVSVKAMVSDTNLKLNSLTTRIEDINEEVVQLWEENYHLESKLDSLEQHSKKFNLIINGLPTEENENLCDQLRELLKELRIEVHNNDVCAIHRLPARNDQIPSIIVRLNNLDLKQLLIKKAKEARLNYDGSKIFIDEHLTRKNAEILKRAKQLTKGNKINSAWFHNGSVRIRESKGGSVRRIDDISQLPMPDQDGNKTPPQNDGNANRDEDRGPKTDRKATTVSTNNKKKADQKQLTLKSHFHRFTRNQTRQKTTAVADGNASGTKEK